MLTLWDYMLALLVLAGTGALVWFILGPQERSWLPEDLWAVDEPPTREPVDTGERLTA